MSELERQPRIQNYTSRFLLKPGKYAYVQNPEYQKKARDFLEEAQGFWKPDKWYYHYASGGHVAAVRSHLKSGVFAHLDISSFYNSVTKAKIIRSLKMIGYSFVEANEIAAESTVLMEGRYVLPYGFCQSPYLATLALAKSELGQRLKRLRRSGFRISLYVDDLIISSDGEDRTNLQSAVDEITRAAAKANFRLNERKYSPPADNVTAFNIKVKKVTWPSRQSGLMTSALS